MATGDNQNYTNRASLLGASGILNRLIGCTTGGDLYNFAHRTLTTQRDATNNDSNKTFTVPAGRLWWLHSIYILYVSESTAGTRQIRCLFTQDGTNFSFDISAGATQAADLTRTYNFAPGVPFDTSFTDSKLFIPIPQRLLLPAAGSIQVVDNAGIAAAADDMTVVLTYDEITV